MFSDLTSVRHKDTTKGVEPQRFLSSKGRFSFSSKSAILSQNRKMRINGSPLVAASDLRRFFSAARASGNSIKDVSRGEERFDL
jgi:hypothetical protein